MTTRIRLLTVGLLCLGTSCGTTSQSQLDQDLPGSQQDEPLTIEIRDPAMSPAPAIEMAAVTTTMPTPSSSQNLGSMRRFDSFAPMANTALEAGCYSGLFIVEHPRLEVAGAGVDRTVIDGNLILASQTVVRDLTVTGDVIFKGNGARMTNVKCLGQVLDYGIQNRH